MSIIPNHVAIIMDGNGRWAEHKALPRIAGHRKGANLLQSVVEFFIEKNVKILTIFALSSENFLSRPRSEVQSLLKLMINLLRKEKIKELNNKNVKLNIIGNTDMLSSSFNKAIQYAEDKTVNNDGLILNVAINYGGRWDIITTTKKLCKLVLEGKIAIKDIDEGLFQNNMSLQNSVDPDLLIRTGGEKRISNFLLWNFAYTEFYFTSKLWPDVNNHLLQDALDNYASRKRNFGFISNQLEDNKTHA